MSLNQLLHVPEITKNLLSVSKFARDNNVFFEFHPNFCLVKDQVSKIVVLEGKLKGGLYAFDSSQIQLQKSAPSQVSLSQSVTSHQFGPSANYQVFVHVSDLQSQNGSPTVGLWHDRLGHPSFKIVQTVMSLCKLSKFNKILPNFVCKACCLGKIHMLPFPTSISEYQEPLQLVYSDLWGPSPVQSSNGYKYYIYFVDAFSRYNWIYLLRNKSNSFQTFQNFKAQAKLQLGFKIKCLQSDWRGEFCAFTDYLTINGIIHRISCPHTHQKNGVAERKHRHIIENGLTLLARASMPFKYWDESFKTVVFLHNRLPSPVSHGKSPL